jgi:RimJ/RimL family protein N-acetyltransferase
LRRSSPPRRGSTATLRLPPDGLRDGDVSLRLPREGDARRIADVCADEEIARWTNVPSPYTLEDAQAWIALAAVERERGTVLNLVAVRQGDDRVLGAVGLRLRDEPERHGESGYWVAPDARRGGVGTRALTLMTEFALGDLALPYVEVVVAPENAPSQAVARGAGFTERRRELRDFKGELHEFGIWRRDAS